MSSRVSSWSGSRSPTVGAKDKFSGSPAFLGTTSVSAPGQNFSASASADGGKKSVSCEIWSSSAVGKLKEKYWKDAVAEYSKRMTAYGKISFEEIKESPGDDIIEEGRDILARIKKDEYVITLEIKGKPMRGTC